MPDFYVRSDDENISVIWPAVRGVASADAMPGAPYWWVSRVLVRDLAARGTGAGSKMLQALQAEFAAKRLGTFLLVSPGGYENDYPRQRRFYERNGFVQAPAEFGEGPLMWTPIDT